MTDRVKQLIENLRFHTESLGYACTNLGFDESELSADELDALHGEIFQCGCCQRWEPSEEFSKDFEFGVICGLCREKLSN